MFLTFRFDSLIIHSAGSDGLAQFGKGFGGLADGRWLALSLLIESSQTKDTRDGTLCPCAVGRMPAIQQIDALTRHAEPNKLKDYAGAISPAPASSSKEHA